MHDAKGQSTPPQQSGKSCVGQCDGNERMNPKTAEAGGTAWLDDAGMKYPW